MISGTFGTSALTWAATDRARAGSPSSTLGAGSRLCRASRSTPPPNRKALVDPYRHRAPNRARPTHFPCHSDQREESLLIPTQLSRFVQPVAITYSSTKCLEAEPLSSCARTHGTSLYAKVDASTWRRGCWQREVPPRESGRRRWVLLAKGSNELISQAAWVRSRDADLRGSMPGRKPGQGFRQLRHEAVAWFETGFEMK